MSALQALFEEWRKFAFGPPDSRAARRLQRTTLILEKERGVEATGEARQVGRRFEIVVRVGYSLASARETLLHEMAHIVADWEDDSYHTRRWRQVFVQAVREVTGQQLDQNCRYFYTLDKQARMAMCRARKQA